jgi:hypothetical protein
MIAHQLVAEHQKEQSAQCNVFRFVNAAGLPDSIAHRNLYALIIYHPNQMVLPCLMQWEFANAGQATNQLAILTPQPLPQALF